MSHALCYNSYGMVWELVTICKFASALSFLQADRPVVAGWVGYGGFCVFVGCPDRMQELP